MHLEHLLIRLDSGREWQPGQICQVIRAKRWPEALVAQALELLPLGRAGVPFQDVVPLLSNASEVEGGELDFLRLRGVLAPKELIASVEQAEWVIFATVGGK